MEVLNILHNEKDILVIGRLLWFFRPFFFWILIFLLRCLLIFWFGLGIRIRFGVWFCLCFLILQLFFFDYLLFGFDLLYFNLFLLFLGLKFNVNRWLVLLVSFEIKEYFKESVNLLLLFFQILLVTLYLHRDQYQEWSSCGSFYEVILLVDPNRIHIANICRLVLRLRWDYKSSQAVFIRSITKQWLLGNDSGSQAFSC